MLCSAKVEVYIEDFFTGWINKINTTDCLVSSLPNSIKAIHFNESFLKKLYKKLIFDNDESHFINTFSNEVDNPIFTLADPLKNSPRLYAEKILSKKKYPSPENFLLLFKRVGINNIFDEIGAASGQNLKNVLTSYNDIRTSISHSGSPIGLNDQDVIRKLLEMKKIICHIDRVLHKHVLSHTGASTWNG